MDVIAYADDGKTWAASFKLKLPGVAFLEGDVVEEGEAAVPATEEAPAAEAEEELPTLTEITITQDPKSVKMDVDEGYTEDFTLTITGLDDYNGEWLYLGLGEEGRVGPIADGKIEQVTVAHVYQETFEIYIAEEDNTQKTQTYTGTINIVGELAPEGEEELPELTGIIITQEPETVVRKADKEYASAHFTINGLDAYNGKYLFIDDTNIDEFYLIKEGQIKHDGFATSFDMDLEIFITESEDKNTALTKKYTFRMKYTEEAEAPEGEVKISYSPKPAEKGKPLTVTIEFPDSVVGKKAYGILHEPLDAAFVIPIPDLGEINEKITKVEIKEEHWEAIERIRIEIYHSAETEVYYSDWIEIEKEAPAPTEELTIAVSPTDVYYIEPLGEDFVDLEEVTVTMQFPQEYLEKGYRYEISIVRQDYGLFSESMTPGVVDKETIVDSIRGENFHVDIPGSTGPAKVLVRIADSDGKEVTRADKDINILEYVPAPEGTITAESLKKLEGIKLYTVSEQPLESLDEEEAQQLIAFLESTTPPTPAKGAWINIIDGKIIGLTLWYNKEITSIDESKLPPNLQELNLKNNKQTSIDLRNAEHILNIDIRGNPLTEIIVNSGFTKPSDWHFPDNWEEIIVYVVPDGVYIWVDSEGNRHKAVYSGGQLIGGDEPPSEAKLGKPISSLVNIILDPENPVHGGPVTFKVTVPKDYVSTEDKEYWYKIMQDESEPDYTIRKITSERIDIISEHMNWLMYTFMITDKNPEDTDFTDENILYRTGDAIYYAEEETGAIEEEAVYASYQEIKESITDYKIRSIIERALRIQQEKGLSDEEKLAEIAKLRTELEDLKNKAEQERLRQSV